MQNIFKNTSFKISHMKIVIISIQKLNNLKLLFLIVLISLKNKLKNKNIYFDKSRNPYLLFITRINRSNELIIVNYNKYK